MKIDIVFVTYNSSKWIERCLGSILKSEYNLKNVSLLFCDNNSNDDTIEKLYDYKNRNESLFNQIQIIESKKNYGFGIGNNKAYKLGNGDYVFFFNIDTELFPDTLSKLEHEINESSKDVGAWELRQSPYEHPKYYDPVTQYVGWASGACIIVKKEVLNQVKGFDKMLFMYSEDVEISWHIRRLGYKIKYLYNVNVMHYSYETPYAFKKTQYIYGIINNLYLRYKYGTLKNMARGNWNCVRHILKRQLIGTVSKKEEKEIQRTLLKEYIKVQFKGLFYAIPSNIIRRNPNDFKAKFEGFDYEIPRFGAFYVIDELPTDGPLVSIIVRTCGRPNYLRETLISIRKQFYKNIEVVIVEDGPNISEDMICSEFADMNINYYAFGQNQGRSKAGNKGLELAKGKYCNFLDDDDLFYPDHVQVLVNELEQTDHKICYSSAFTTVQDIKDKENYKYEIKYITRLLFGEFSILNILKNNITPIQSVMFEKSVYEECGGFDETIEALEDWDLWIRFALKYKFKYIDKTTSLYRVPYKNEVGVKRQEFLNSTLEYVVNKYKDEEIKLTAKDVYYGKE